MAIYTTIMVNVFYYFFPKPFVAKIIMSVFVEKSGDYLQRNAKTPEILLNSLLES